MHRLPLTRRARRDVLSCDAVLCCAAQARRSSWCASRAARCRTRRAPPLASSPGERAVLVVRCDGEGWHAATSQGPHQPMHSGQAANTDMHWTELVVGRTGAHLPGQGGWNNGWWISHPVTAPLAQRSHVTSSCQGVCFRPCAAWPCRAVLPAARSRLHTTCSRLATQRCRTCRSVRAAAVLLPSCVHAHHFVLYCHAVLAVPPCTRPGNSADFSPSAAPRAGWQCK